jgi:hypothetical protein
MTGRWESRCANGRPCGEVADRLVAADVARLAGEIEAAQALREKAARFAELHDHGRQRER